MTNTDVLRDLEDRVISLERLMGESPPPDTLQPNVLTVNPDGTIGALLSGGLELNEAASPGTVTAQTAVSWIDAAPLVRANLRGTLVSPSTHQITMSAHGDGRPLNGTGPAEQNFATFLAHADVAGAAGSAAVVATAKDTAGAQQVATIIDSLGRSSFLQLAAALAARKIAFGLAQFTWTAAQQGTAVLPIAHGLPAGVTPVLVLGLAVPLAGTNTSYAVQVAGGADAVHINLQIVASVAQPINQTMFAYWLAIG